jgi:protease I
MGLKGLRIGILVEQQYQELEFWYPRLRFEEEGADMVVIGPAAKETYASKLGYPATSDAAAGEVQPGDLDALIVPGGFAPDFMRRTPAMVDLVKAVAERGAIVAAICHAGWMLVSADLVRGRRVTSFPSLKQDMKNAGGTWVDEAVVRDGNIITSRVPGDLPAFCLAIKAALTEAREEPEATSIPVSAGR